VLDDKINSTNLTKENVEKSILSVILYKSHEQKKLSSTSYRYKKTRALFK